MMKNSVSVKHRVCVFGITGRGQHSAEEVLKADCKGPYHNAKVKRWVFKLFSSPWRILDRTSIKSVLGLG